jgi:hypothetical protein
MCVSFHGQEQQLRLGSQHRLDQPAQQQLEPSSDVNTLNGTIKQSDSMQKRQAYKTWK